MRTSLFFGKLSSMMKPLKFIYSSKPRLNFWFYKDSELRISQIKWNFLDPGHFQAKLTESWTNLSQSQTCHFTPAIASCIRSNLKKYTIFICAITNCSNDLSCLFEACKLMVLVSVMSMNIRIFSTSGKILKKKTLAFEMCNHFCC